MLRESPSQNLINFQLECNRNFKETVQSQPKPESHQFSIPYLAERGGAKRRRARQPGMMLACNRNFKETAQGQPKPDNFQLECNRNFKETAQGQPKPEFHQFSIRM